MEGRGSKGWWELKTANLVAVALWSSGELAIRERKRFGDPLYNRIWTLLQVPCISVPFGTGPRGLPLSVQLVGRVGEDDRILAAADWVYRRLGV